MLQNLLRQLLPGTCLMCDGPIAPCTEPDLCHHCLAELPWNEGACPRCGEPGRTGATPFPVPPCTLCQARPPPFSAVIAPLRYEGFAKAWVGRLKDHLGMVEGRILGTLLADAAERRYREVPGLRRPDLLIPVPLTARRLARRGHNQALTLARPVAARLSVPVLRRAVIRQHPGQRQRGLGRAARLRNPSGSFTARRAWSSPGPCIGVVDDVMTTGATVTELTRRLLTAGAEEVHVLCAARTARHQPSAYLTRVGSG